MKLNDWIEWKRKLKGNVGKDLGIHPSHLSRLLSGERRCSPILAQRIEKYTGGDVPKELMIWPKKE